MKFTLIIKKNKTFKYILRNAKYKTSKTIAVHSCPTRNNENVIFFAVCVSKKNGNSVERNKLKRWVREAYKLEESKLKKGYNILVIYKKTTNVANTNFNSIHEDIIKCFKELGLYEN
ncbi:MAG: ribonuclease P protein component [Clostridia bacterium]|nr:ribonuclease P protein component [Clostridia bacterium]